MNQEKTVKKVPLDDYANENGWQDGSIAENKNSDRRDVIDTIQWLKSNGISQTDFADYYYMSEDARKAAELSQALKLRENEDTRKAAESLQALKLKENEDARKTAESSQLLRFRDIIFYVNLAIIAGLVLLLSLPLFGVHTYEPEAGTYKVLFGGLMTDVLGSYLGIIRYIFNNTKDSIESYKESKK